METLREYEIKSIRQSKRVVAQTQKRGRAQASCGGAFLRLDLLVTFGSSQK
ncbi:hypothetical protein [Mucilaginibacter agri]|uniref:Uncharacterized protein n=1 Tax=Mucilaginibacter agri TaxID=2695265 RepID=A0A965ZKG6_9SPHI|nr:hypothetical protein [Mucilaginibacter agri]NCD71579.1 hypothetical protein [Mucilaginibacter agri]